MNETLQEWMFWWEMFCYEQGWDPDTVTKIVVISLIVLMLLIVGVIVFCKMRRSKAETELPEDTGLDSPASEEDSEWGSEDAGDVDTEETIDFSEDDAPFTPEPSPSVPERPHPPSVPARPHPAPASSQPQPAPVSSQPHPAPVSSPVYDEPMKEPIAPLAADIPATENHKHNGFEEETTMVADDLKKLVLRCWRSNTDYVDSAVSASRLKKFREGILLGRGEGCHLQFACKTVSRRHAVIRERGGAFYIMDVGSSCGTALNGRPLEKMVPCPLKNGDRLYMGLPGKGVKVSVLVKEQ